MFCSQCGTKAEIADKYCQRCGTALAGIPPDPVVPGLMTGGSVGTVHSQPNAGVAVTDESGVLAALRAYVGQNWESHYRVAFESLHHSRQSRTAAGWTWNWPAALIPVWYLYRRLYLAFFGFLLLLTFINMIDQAAAGSANGGSPFALLFLVQLVVMGFAGDRLLFRKAYSKVTSATAPRDEAQLRALGKPLRWVIWIPIIIFGVAVLAGVLAAVLIPLIAR